jgi:glutamate dehydrogenase (NAD(P)+)
MSWIKDAYQGFVGHKDVNAVGCCTGKAQSQGGISGRLEGPGLGAFYVTREVLEDPAYCDANNIPFGIKNKSLIVKGFGQLGYYYSKYMVQHGAKLVGVIEVDGSIYHDNGTRS